VSGQLQRGQLGTCMGPSKGLQAELELSCANETVPKPTHLGTCNLPGSCGNPVSAIGGKIAADMRIAATTK
jgi:hypothetical protein